MLLLFPCRFNAIPASSGFIVFLSVYIPQRGKRITKHKDENLKVSFQFCLVLYSTDYKGVHVFCL